MKNTKEIKPAKDNQTVGKPRIHQNKKIRIYEGMTTQGMNLREQPVCMHLSAYRFDPYEVFNT